MRSSNVRKLSRATGAGLLAGMAALVCILAAVVSAEGTDAAGVAKGRNVRLPGYDEQGRLKFEILGDTMSVLLEGVLEVVNPRLEFLTNGVRDLAITAGKCVYVPSKGEATSDLDVRLERRNMLITGRGFKWLEAKQVVEIVDNVRMAIENVKDLAGTAAREPEGGKGEADNGESATAARQGDTTLVTARKLSFDYEQRVGNFLGQVNVVDPQIKVDAEEMTVCFSEQNRIESISARRSVRIAQDEMAATCDAAHCDVAGETMVLRGNAEVLRGTESVKADAIMIFRGIDRIICLRGHLRLENAERLKELDQSE